MGRLKKSVRKAIAVITAVLAGISAASPVVPIEAQNSTYSTEVTEESGKLNVTASAEAGVLPDDAELVVTPVRRNGNKSLYEATQKKLTEAAQNEHKTVDAFAAYDIQFQKDGKAVEPAGGTANVTLKWNGECKPDSVADGDQISVVHLKDNVTPEKLTEKVSAGGNHAAVVKDEKNPLSVKSVAITSNSFSVYAVVWSKDNEKSENTSNGDASVKVAPKKVAVDENVVNENASDENNPDADDSKTEEAPSADENDNTNLQATVKYGNNTIDLGKEGEKTLSAGWQSTFTIHVEANFSAGKNKRVNIHLPYGMSWNTGSNGARSWDSVDKNAGWYQQLDSITDPNDQSDQADRPLIYSCVDRDGKIRILIWEMVQSPLILRT